MRYLALSKSADAYGEDADEARRTIRKLVPFLSDKRSRTVFSGLDDAVTDVWSRMDEVRDFPPLARGVAESSTENAIGANICCFTEGYRHTAQAVPCRCFVDTGGEGQVYY